jgi:hypothetical protein
MGLFKPLVRWLFVLAGAVIGSYAGRVAAAAYRGEPVEPLLRLDRAALMRPDVVPGFLAVEFAGKVLGLGPLSAGVVAAAAAGAAAFLDGPFVARDKEADVRPAAGGGDVPE